MPPPRLPAGVVDVPEEVGQGLHVFDAQCHPGHSMLQAGVETEGAEPGTRRAGQGPQEHQLRTRVGDVALSVAGEAPREPGLGPVRGAAGGPVEAGRVHEGLQEQDLVAEAGRPVTDDAPGAQRKDARAQVARRAGQDQEPGVVRDGMQAAELEAAVPADPAVARPALQRRGREHRKRQPAVAVTGDVAQGLADGPERAKAVMRLHQRAEARLVLFRDDVDRHLRKIHARAPATDSPEPWRGGPGMSGFKVNFMSGLGKVAWTNWPWHGAALR